MNKEDYYIDYLEKHFDFEFLERVYDIVCDFYNGYYPEYKLYEIFQWHLGMERANAFGLACEFRRDDRDQHRLKIIADRTRLIQDSENEVPNIIVEGQVSLSVDDVRMAFDCDDYTANHQLSRLFVAFGLSDRFQDDKVYNLSNSNWTIKRIFREKFDVDYVKELHVFSDHLQIEVDLGRIQICTNLSYVKNLISELFYEYLTISPKVTDESLDCDQSNELVFSCDELEEDVEFASVSSISHWNSAFKQEESFGGRDRTLTQKVLDSESDIIKYCESQYDSKGEYIRNDVLSKVGDHISRLNDFISSDAYLYNNRWSYAIKRRVDYLNFGLSCIDSYYKSDSDEKDVCFLMEKCAHQFMLWNEYLKISSNCRPSLSQLGVMGAMVLGLLVVIKLKFPSQARFFNWLEFGFEGNSFLSDNWEKHWSSIEGCYVVRINEGKLLAEILPRVEPASRLPISILNPNVWPCKIDEIMIPSVGTGHRLVYDSIRSGYLRYVSLKYFVPDLLGLSSSECLQILAGEGYTDFSVWDSRYKGGDKVSVCLVFLKHPFVYSVEVCDIDGKRSAVRLALCEMVKLVGCVS